jgi:hypothetical protein
MNINVHLLSLKNSSNAKCIYEIVFSILTSPLIPMQSRGKKRSVS